MDGLRKDKTTHLKKVANETAKSKEEVQYQKYLNEVRALNIVKEFLAQNRDSLSHGHKTQLVAKIVEEQKRLSRIEKNLKKR